MKIVKAKEIGEAAVEALLKKKAFDEKTGKATTGWFTVDGVQYFAIGGEVQRGIVWILLNVYHFDETTGALIAKRSIFGRW